MASPAARQFCHFYLYPSRGTANNTTVLLNVPMEHFCCAQEKLFAQLVQRELGSFEFLQEQDTDSKQYGKLSISCGRNNSECS